MNLRYLWRSVSLVFVLWFALFPTLSYASETVTNQTYTYDWREAERELLEYSQDTGEGVSTWSIKDTEITGGYLDTSVQLYSVSNGVFTNIFNVGTGSYLPPYTYSMPNLSMNATQYNIWRNTNDSLEARVMFSNSSGANIFDKGDVVSINLTGLFFAYHNSYSWSIGNVGGGSTSYAEPFDNSKIVRLSVGFENGTNNQYIDVTDSLTRDGDTIGYNISNLEVPVDTRTLNFIIVYDYSADDLDSSKCHNGFLGWNGTGMYEFRFVNSSLSIEVEDKTTGLLSGIIEWLRSIRDGIVNVGSGVTNVFNSILELPSRIWTFIQEGLKMLFIPSEQDISNMHNQWDELMRDRFGAIYESGDIVHSFADTMNVNSAMVADTGGVITMPSVTANLAGTNFTFGGYEVDLVPDGFQWLVTSIKMLINIVCTILFINALKGKIEVLLR